MMLGTPDDEDKEAIDANAMEQKAGRQGELMKSTNSDSDRAMPMPPSAKAEQFSQSTDDADVGPGTLIAPSSAIAAAAASAATMPNAEYESTGTSSGEATGKKRQRRVGRVKPQKLAKKAPVNLSDTADSEGTGETSKVLSKHDERWNAMFEKLIEYKQQNNSTQVPQCYDNDPRLGRWVHYQRGTSHDMNTCAK
jgi:hypothetical protein